MRTIPELACQREFLNQKGEMRERDLLLATLDRAVLDYYGSERVALGEEAGEWLFGESDPQTAFSLEWICDYLVLEPALLRKRVRELSLPRDDMFRAHRWLRSKVRSEDRFTALVRRGDRQ